MEDQIRNLHLHLLNLRHVTQEQRVVCGGLEGKRAAAEDAVVEVLFDLDVGNAREGQIVAGALDDARAGDDSLRRHRVGRRYPLDPGNKDEWNRQEEHSDPDGRECPVARVLGDVEGANCGGDHEDGLDDDRGQQLLDVSMHVADDDLVLAEKLL